MHPGYSLPTHPLHAGTRAAQLWIVAALAGLASLAFVLAGVVHIATVSAWSPTALLLLWLTGFLLAISRRYLVRRAWRGSPSKPTDGLIGEYRMNVSPPRRHQAEIVVACIHHVMVVLTFMSIVASDAAFPNRAALLGVIAVVGLGTIVLWQNVARFICDCVSPGQLAAGLVAYIQPLVTAITVLGLALHRSPQAAQSIPPVIVMTLIALTVFAIAKRPSRRGAIANRLQRLDWSKRSDSTNPEM